MSTTHAHLLLNHFPTVGLVMTIGLFLAGIVARSDQLKRASLVAFIGLGLIVLPTYVTGNAAAETLCIGKVAEPCADSQISRPLIERHEGAAVLALTLIVTTAGFAWLGLWQHRRTQRIAPWNIVVIALTSSVAMGLVARAANIGGEIRHPEVRAAAAPAATEPTLGRRIARYVNDEPWTWIASETLHFVGLSLLIGVVTLIDLRALGVMKAIPFSALERLLPWAALGFGPNIATGMLFFISRPEFYTGNPAFYWKLIFVLLASTNTVYFFFDEGWAATPGGDVRLVTKVAAASALVLWVGVMYWGSMLPFIGNSF
jgi:hypothetical protein